MDGLELVGDVDFQYLLDRFTPGERWPMQHRLLLFHYLTNGYKIGRAAISAGYAESSAHVSGSRLINSDKFQAVISGYFSLFAMGRAELLGRLSVIARNAGADLLTGDAESDIAALRDAGLSFLIRRVYRTRAGLNVELHDSARALELIGREAGVWSTPSLPDNGVTLQVFNQSLTQIFEGGKDKSRADDSVAGAAPGAPPSLGAGSTEVLGSLPAADRAEITAGLFTDHPERGELLGSDGVGLQGGSSPRDREGRELTDQEGAHPSRELKSARKFFDAGEEVAEEGGTP